MLLKSQEEEEDSEEHNNGMAEEVTATEVLTGGSVLYRSDETDDVTGVTGGQTNTDVDDDKKTLGDKCSTDSELELTLYSPTHSHTHHHHHPVHHAYVNELSGDMMPAAAPSMACGGGKSHQPACELAGRSGQCFSNHVTVTCVPPPYVPRSSCMNFPFSGELVHRFLSGSLCFFADEQASRHHSIKL